MSSKGERLQDEGSRLQVAVAGGMAGLISRFIVAPLDVVKIRLQLQTHSLSDPLLAQRDLRGSPVYKGTLRTMRHIVTHEGLTGLWKGNVPAEAMYVCYSAVQFSTYRAATLLLQEGGQALGLGLAPRPGLEAFAAGAAAGACATAATYPLDLLRTRFAAQGSGHDRVYTNLRQALRTIARDEGLRGFFRGLGPALVQIAPFMGIFFAVYEGLRRPFRALAGGAGAGGEGKPNTPGSSAHRGLDLFRAAGGPDAAAGMIAAVASKTAVFPLDLLRKRIQVQGPTRQHYVHKNIPAYDGGMAATLRTILRHEGVRGLYRGLTVSLIKAAPASTITMWTYERLLNAMMEWQQERDGGRTAV